MMMLKYILLLLVGSSVTVNGEQISEHVQKSLLQRTGGALKAAKDTFARSVLSKDSAVKAIKKNHPEVTDAQAKQAATDFFKSANDFLTKKGVEEKGRNDTILAVLESQNGSTGKAMECIKNHGESWKQWKLSKLKAVYKQHELSCESTEQRAKKMNAKIQSFTITPKEKAAGNTFQLDGYYMAEAADPAGLNANVYGKQLARLMDCYHHNVDGKLVGVGKTLEKWANDGKLKEQCGYYTEEQKKGKAAKDWQTDTYRTKGDILEAIEHAGRVVFLTPQQQEAFTLKITHHELDVPALGGRIGKSGFPDCSMMEKAMEGFSFHKEGWDKKIEINTWALAHQADNGYDPMAYQREKDKSKQFCDRNDIPFKCADLKYTGKPFTLLPYEQMPDKPEQLAFVLRNVGGKDVVHVGPHHTGLMHHSSLWNGKPCKSAGRFYFKKSADKEIGARIMAISAETGHYKATWQSLKIMIKWLIDNGFDSKKNWCGERAIKCIGSGQDGEPRPNFCYSQEWIPKLKECCLQMKGDYVTGCAI